MPAYLDEVTVLQQPRGSYSLEVRPNILPKIRTQDKRLQSVSSIKDDSLKLDIFKNIICLNVYM